MCQHKRKQNDSANFSNFILQTIKTEWTINQLRYLQKNREDKAVRYLATFLIQTFLKAQFFSAMQS